MLLFMDLEVFYSCVYTVRSSTLPEELDEKKLTLDDVSVLFSCWLRPVSDEKGHEE